MRDLWPNGQNGQMAKRDADQRPRIQRKSSRDIIRGTLLLDSIPYLVVKPRGSGYRQGLSFCYSGEHSLSRTHVA